MRLFKVPILPLKPAPCLTTLVVLVLALLSKGALAQVLGPVDERGCADTFWGCDPDGDGDVDGDNIPMNSHQDMAWEHIHREDSARARPPPSPPKVIDMSGNGGSDDDDGEEERPWYCLHPAIAINSQVSIGVNNPSNTIELDLINVEVNWLELLGCSDD